MIEIDRCGWCVHKRDMIDGWLPACDAFPNGNKNSVYDMPGRDCANGIRFEVSPEKKEMYDCFWGDLFGIIPYNVEEYYEEFLKSEIPAELTIDGERFFRIVGKLETLYDSGPRVSLLVPMNTFYVTGINQLTELIDETGKRISIRKRDGYAPQFGLHYQRWQGFACLIEVTNIENKYQIGNYIRVLRRDELEAWRCNDARTGRWKMPDGVIQRS